MKTGLFDRLASKTSDKAMIADEIMSDPRLLDLIIDGLNAKPARIKYGCAKVLRIISDKDPGLLYPYFDLFADMLDSSNNILKWEGIYIIGNLAGVDSREKIVEIFDKLFEPIVGPVMITANNIIAAGLKIAVAKPQLSDKVAEELKKVEKAKYQTMECRSIALGKVITGFDNIYDHISDRESANTFVRKQLKNTRASTKKKAEEFCLKHNIRLNRNY